MMIRLQSNYHHRSLGLLTLLMIMTIMIVPFNNIMRSTVKTTTIGLSSLMINYEKYRSLSSSSTNTHYYVCAFTATNRQYTTINTQNRISLVSSSSLFTPKTTHHRSFTSLGEKTTNSADDGSSKSGGGNKVQQKKNNANKSKGDNNDNNIKEKKEKNPFASTILLPITTFSQRADAIIREPQIQQYWKDTALYDVLSKQYEKNERYVLHDGPPYANGNLHCGHALNKMLKDFINRYQLLLKKQVHYIPGWDCHGLPIELKVLQNMKQSERTALSPIQLREKAASFAMETIEQQQSNAFQRFGIYGNFEKPYYTMQSQYESAQIRVFGTMYEKGYIFRGRKPVHWSPSSQTALAEAELEYPDNHISKSIYVTFRVIVPSPSIESYHTINEPIDVAIWTTTPWTIPANMAIAVNADIDYSIIQHPLTKQKLIVAYDLISSIANKWKCKYNIDNDDIESLKILTTVKGSDLVSTTYQHPLYIDRISPILIGGDYITTESGTGLVHTAPGHGQEDYITGIKYLLPIFSPVDDLGKYTSDVIYENLIGQPVLGIGNDMIIELLQNSSSLICVENYNHKYPYDWRTKKPTIFRATDQWFASVADFRKDALDAVETVKWVPDVGKNRIKSFIDTRGDWCISRQRAWGVPIPVFYDRDTEGKEFLLNNETIHHVEQLFAQHGSNCWWTMDEVDLLPEKYKSESSRWKKGTDTMDVWFDSGSSWAGVLQSRSDELKYPADLYLEGSDQHRGWFQSSLLTSVANNKMAPYKTVLTHGFVLDEKGFKMSKSLGNVIDPMIVINGGNNKKTQPAYGADVLRLWVANSDYSGDVSIGDNIIKQTFESYRKLRNTARYLIGNLNDFVPSGQSNSNEVPYDDLPSMDKWLLGRLSSVLSTVKTSYEEYAFQRAVQEVLRFATADLSSFYLDVAKDRLYISGIDDPRRRSCQTVIYSCLVGLSKAISPILPHMAEDIYQNIPFIKSTDSVFQGGWPDDLMNFPETDIETWDLILSVRDDVNKMLEIARTDKLIGASLDAAAYIYVSDPIKKQILEKLIGDDNLITPPVKTNGVDELRTALMLSQVILVDNVEAISEYCDTKYISGQNTISGCIVGVRKALGKKCSRCWFYDHQVGMKEEEREGAVSSHEHHHDDVCQRCNTAIADWEIKTGQTFVRPMEEVEEIVVVKEAKPVA